MAPVMEKVSQEMQVVTIEKIRLWQAGSYALKLCSRYLADSFCENSAVKFHQAEVGGSAFIKVSNIVSRFRSGVKRTVVLRLGRFADDGALVGACTSPSGARSIGGCGHVVFVLWLFAKLVDIHVTQRIPYGDIKIEDLVSESIVPEPRGLVDLTAWSKKRRAEKKESGLAQPTQTVYQVVEIAVDVVDPEPEVYDEDYGDPSDEAAASADEDIDDDM